MQKLYIVGFVTVKIIMNIKCDKTFLHSICRSNVACQMDLQ